MGGSWLFLQWVFAKLGCRTVGQGTSRACWRPVVQDGATGSPCPRPCGARGTLGSGLSYELLAQPTPHLYPQARCPLLFMCSAPARPSWATGCTTWKSR